MEMRGGMDRHEKEDEGQQGDDKLPTRANEDDSFFPPGQQDTHFQGTENQVMSPGSSTLMHVLNAISDLSHRGEGEASMDHDSGEDLDGNRSSDGGTKRPDDRPSHTGSLEQIGSDSGEDRRPLESVGDGRAKRPATARRTSRSSSYMNSSLAALQSMTELKITEDDSGHGPADASPDQSPSTSAGPSPVTRARPSRKSSREDSRPKILSSYDEQNQAANGRPRTCSISDLQRRKKLAKACQDIFHLDDLEEVVAEYPCWLLRSVLLQGYLYLTTGHLCFFAYLPKDIEGTVRQGLLSKKASRTRQYWKHWFVLQNDVLSWYDSSTDLYFPISNIDLRYALAVEPSAKNDLHFKIITAQKVYRFATESRSNRDDWVRTVRKTMFKTRNQGDSVKIAIPLEIVVAVERGKNFEFADTLRVRVQEDGAPQSFVNAADDQSSSREGRGAESGFHVEEDHYDFAYFPDIKAAHRIVINQVRDFEQAVQAHLAQSNTSSSTLRHEILDTTHAAAIVASGTGSTAEQAHSHHIARKQVYRGQQGSKPEMKPVEDASALSKGSLPEGGSSPVGDSAESVEKEGDSSNLPHKAADKKQRLEASQDTLRPSQEHSYPPTGTVEESASGDESSKSWGKWIKDRSGSQLHRLATATPIASNFFSTGRLRPLRKRRVSEQWLSSDAREGVDKKKDPVTSFTDEPAQYASGSSVIRADTRPELQTEEEMPRDHAEAENTIWSHRSQEDTAQTGQASPSGDTGTQTGTKAHEDLKLATEKFRSTFALPNTEHLSGYFSGYISRMIPTYGKLYISRNFFCFRSTTALSRLRMKVPLRDIQAVSPQKSFRPNYYGMVVMVKGHEELFFEFGYVDKRDVCLETLGEAVEQAHAVPENKEGTSSTEGKHEAMMLEELELHQHMSAPGPGFNTKVSQVPPLMFQSSSSSDFLTWKPTEVLHITCLTIGSRGDVQPYIALCKGLQKDGHRTRIATHGEYKEWIEGHGIEFGYVGGDPAELMRICVENGMFTYSFLREGVAKFRGWLDDLLATSWTACQGTDLLIESPSAMAGYHIAEALNIPYFRAFTMPWSRTRAYPHAFGVPDVHMGGGYNYSSYVIFDQVFWRATSGQINRWRKASLSLQPTSLDKMDQQRIPFLYNFSPSVVPPPLDWHAWIQVTGYWFLDQADDSQSTKWEAPKELTDFMQKARDDKKKIVYIGFGSIVVSNPVALTQSIVEAVLQSDVRCILSKGWSDRLSSKKQDEQSSKLTKEEASKKKKEQQRKEEDNERKNLPDVIYPIKSIPHDWLFSRIDAAVHHGGAGTTGASLRAGIVTVIRPYFGDQFFWADRIAALGVGSSIKKMDVNALSDALKHATQDQKQIDRARLIGERIRSEDGVHEAIRALYFNYEYALSLVKKDTHLKAEEVERLKKKRTKEEKEEGGAKPSSPTEPPNDEQETSSDWSIIDKDNPGPSQDSHVDESGYSLPPSPQTAEESEVNGEPTRRRTTQILTSPLSKGMPALTNTLSSLLPSHGHNTP